MRRALWRFGAGSLGCVTVAMGALALRDPLASMSTYTAGLMVLNQVAPPLLLLGLPLRLTRTHRIAAVFDPWVATALFVGLSVVVSFPAILDPTLANALYAAPLGLLELISGLLFWGQLVPLTRYLRVRWQIALLAWAGSVPMTVVALVWMLSSHVIYTPYLDVICRWDISPLADQKWAGFVMFVAGAPLQLAAAWILLTKSEDRDDRNQHPEFIATHRRQDRAAPEAD